MRISSYNIFKEREILIMDKNRLMNMLKEHAEWLKDSSKGHRAILSDTDLSDANLSDANLRGVDLTGADLTGADLIDADLTVADLTVADLRNAILTGANLRGANLRGADLRGADLRGVDLRNAILSDADLIDANLRGANLSGVTGLTSPIDFIRDNFEFNNEGLFVYKTFDGIYTHPASWILKPGEVISEVANHDRTAPCGCGINVAPYAWVLNHYIGEVWKLLIRWEWAAGIVVPYSTDGKIRCEKAELIEIVKRY